MPRYSYKFIKHDRMKEPEGNEVDGVFQYVLFAAKVLRDQSPQPRK